MAVEVSLSTPVATDLSAFLRRDAAARYITERYGIPCSRQTLAKYATCGGGPKYRKAGRYPMYPREALDIWVANRLTQLVGSSSELAAA